MTPIEYVKSVEKLIFLVQRDVKKLSKSGNCLTGLCPFHADKEESFAFYPPTDSWYCFAGCGGGDVVDYLTLLHGYEAGNVKPILAQYLKQDSLQQGTGIIIKRGSPPEPAPITDESVAEMEQRNKKINELAKKCYDGSLIIRTMQMEHVPHTYLNQTRGIPYALGETRLANAIRFNGACLVKNGKTYEKHPAIVNGFYRFYVEDGVLGWKMMGIQRTFLTPSGEKHAKLPKRMLGNIRSAICPVWTDPNADNSVAYVSEGFEDALSFPYLVANPVNVYYCGGVQNFATDAYPPFVRHIKILADNDDKPQVVNAYNKAIELLETKYDSVEVVRPDSQYKDFNEQIVAEMIQL